MLTLRCACACRPVQLRIGEDAFKPDEVPHLEVVTDEIVVPREAMGLGDVKFMAAIGAFLGWPGGDFLVDDQRHDRRTDGRGSHSVALQQGGVVQPGYLTGLYIALAATIWIFAGQRIASWWLSLAR